MKHGRLIAGLIWLALAVGLIAGLVGLIQRLMISGATFFDELGGLMVSDDEALMVKVQPTVDLNELFSIDSFDGEPVETPEPEEMVQIPIEQTPEELAEENKQKLDEEAGGER